MNALTRLTALLEAAVQEGGRPMQMDHGLDALVDDLQKRFTAPKANLREDLQLAAVKRFWDDLQISSFRDAYLLSWGLCLPHEPGGACILEDTARFTRVLLAADRESGRPAAFRRCYQGLLKSYFTYDALHDGAPNDAIENWTQLRRYLKTRAKDINTARLDPDWVAVAQQNRQLFSQQPCEPYVDALLRGDSSVVDRISKHLGVPETSWFQRQLILEQVRSAAREGDSSFQSLLPYLVELVCQNLVLRDRGLALLLDRYANVADTPLNPLLRDRSVLHWGNPWLPSKQKHWGGVSPQARTMVSDWLKREFIEAFFSKLAEDGIGDTRRMEFWLRYIPCITSIQFALGRTARSSRDRDLVALRAKMSGLMCELATNSGDNNAFIMTMGSNLVVVEFSDLGNALYGYDSPDNLPFNTMDRLQLGVDSRNSLKQSDAAVRWRHHDGIHGWDKWEAMFEDQLLRKFGIAPESTTKQPMTRPVPARPPVAEPLRSAPASSQRQAETGSYTRQALAEFASKLALRVEDNSARGGSLWVRTEDNVPGINRVLSNWGFRYKPGKGWWR